MSAHGVWFGNNAWPSGRSPGDFAKDVFRLEGCTTDKEKAFAFYKWMLRCMNRGPNFYQASASGTYARVFNPLAIFTWGHHECTGFGWVAAEALQAAGLKARRMVANQNGHTFYEVWYKGDDGKEAWHAFDPFLGWYFLNASGEVASTDELGQDPTLVHNPHPGHADPCGHDWIRIKLSRRSAVYDWLDVVQEVKNEQLAYELQQGQTFSALWKPSEAHNACLTYNDALPGERGRQHPYGAHCDIDQYDHTGRLRYPEHEPYWNNYRWPDHRDSRKMVRYHGSGTLTWTPMLYGEAVTEYSANTVFENGMIRTKGTNTYAEVWYKIKLPYPAAHIAVDWHVRGSGNAGLSISTDEGRTFWALQRTNAPGGGLLMNGQADYLSGKPSIQGVREFIVRIDLLCYTQPDDFIVDAFRLMIGFHHNMHVQPRLLPGDNQLYLEADSIEEGRTLSVRWNYTGPNGDAEETITLEKTGKAEKDISVSADKPDDIIMRGVTLELT